MRFPILFALALIALAGRAQDTCDVSVVVTSPTCPGDHDGSIMVVQGNGGPFTFDWSHAPQLHSALATALFAGPYTVTVTGASGCVSVIDTVVHDPAVPALGTMTTTNISCAGMDDGSVTFTVFPGPYVWHWTDDPVPDPGNTRVGLGPGDYTVMISGAQCPSYVTGSLGSPDIGISGAAVYCPSDPAHLTTDLYWGFQPDIYVWSTGDSTSAIDVVLGTSGLITVTATDTSIGCTASGDFTLTALAGPTVVFDAPDTVCIRTGAYLHTTVSTADSLIWRWGTDGITNEPAPTITFFDPLWQHITLQGFDSLGCGSAPVLDSIFVQPRIPALFTVEQIPCTPMVQLWLGSAADSCAFFVDDSLMFSDCTGWIRLDMRRYLPHTLTFYSTQPDHCDDTSSVSIDLRTPPILALPNAFTPNGDGINDTWPGPIEIPDLGYQVQLFDRWGHSLWATTDTQEKWDGAALPEGVYVYTLHVHDPCEPKKKIETNGTVTLMR